MTADQDWWSKDALLQPPDGGTDDGWWKQDEVVPDHPRLTIRPPSKSLPIERAIEAAPKAIQTPELPEAPPSDIWRLPMQGTAGFNEALYTVLGAPVDALTWLINHGGAGVNAMVGDDVVGKIKRPVLGSEWIEDLVGGAGVPKPSEMPAQSPEERVVRGLGEGVGYMVAPEAMIGVLAKAGALTPKAARFFGNIFGRSSSTADFAKSAVIGGAGGVGTAVAEEAAPEPYKGVAGVLGGLGAGLGAGLMAEAPAIARAGARATKDFTAPFTEEGRKRLAAQTIEEAASDPKRFREALETEPQELVPGSKPTTFQMTGDLGVGGLERKMATLDPEPFRERAGQQNAARVRSTEELVDTGDPVALPDALRRERGQIEGMMDEAVRAAEERARAVVSELPTEPSERILAMPRVVRAELDRIDALGRAASEDAAQEAAAAAKGLGGLRAPEEYGSALRETLLARRAEAKAAERALWNAVDPDKTLAIDVSPLRSTARRVVKEMSSSAKPMTGDERRVFAIASGYKPVIRFEDLRQFRSHVNAVMSEELRSAGQTPTYARLAELRGEIERAIDTAVERRAVTEARAVEAGDLDISDAMASRLLAETEEWFATRGSAEARDAAEAGAARAPAVSPGPRGEGASTGRSRDSTRDPGLPRDDALIPNFDEAAAGRLKAASQATKERARTYDEGPVGKATRTTGARDSFRVPSAGVPAVLFRPGATGAEDVAAFRRAVRDDAAALAQLADYAAAQVRRAAARPDGTLDPKAVAQWLSSHQDAMRAFPGLRGKIEEAAALSGEAADVAEAVATTRLPYERGALGDLVRLAGMEGLLEPREVAERLWKVLGRLKDDPVAMREARAIFGPDGLDDMAKEAATWAVRRAAETPDGMIDPKRFEAWRRANAGTLRTLPEVERSFANAAEATRSIDDYVRLRKEALADYETGAVAKLLGVTHPADVQRIVGAIFDQQDAVAQMARLAAKAKADPEAWAGLRRAVATYLSKRLISNTEGATSGVPLLRADQFQTFVKNNSAALSKVFSNEEIGRLSAIAQDIQRANRSIVAIKLPGGPGTAQDLSAQRKNVSIFANILVTEVLGALGGAALAGTPGLIGGALGARVVAGLRRNQMEKVDDIVREMLLHPELARAMLAKMPERPDSGTALTLAQQLRRLSLAVGAASAPGQ